MRALYFLLFLCLVGCDSSKKENTINKVNSLQKEETITSTHKNKKLNIEQQITSALFSAPKQVRNEAKVYGYDQNNNLIVLKEGTNNFICIADNPNKDGFEVVAYHSSLEPFMSRGRVLSREGKSRQEKETIRATEAKSGVLKMPINAATLHIYYGKEGFFNTKTDSIENAKYRYVVYIPYATQELTGLPLSPNENNHPWLMFPGKYNAHIMISPK